MCIQKVRAPNGYMIPCRKCWQCVSQYSNDWIGRCLAESKIKVTGCFMLTLTYGRDEEDESLHPRTQTLTYRDVQNFFKILRYYGYDFSYLCVGEYGSLKGRAHWHILMFFRDDLPQHEIHKRFKNDYWPHGWQYWKVMDEANIRYVCKYLMKDIEASRNDVKVHSSTRPPIGYLYFDQLARKYAEAGLAPQNALYSFPDVKSKDKNGGVNAMALPQKFMMSDTTQSNFYDAYLRYWKEIKGTKHPPTSKWLDEMADRRQRAKGDPEWTPDGTPRNLIKPPYRGTLPRVGFDVVLQTQGLYSKDDLGTLWYRKINGEYKWLREAEKDIVAAKAVSYQATPETPSLTPHDLDTMDQMSRAVLRDNPYYRAKQGLQEPRKRKFFPATVARR
ncbi:MAG: replication initiator protein [Microviridae sp.]|nr:MAG: replication initiator protein [Microviridae sp.]